MRMNTALIRKDSKPAVEPGLWIPEKWNDGVITWLDAVRQQTNSEFADGEVSVRESLPRQIKNLGELAVTKGIYGMPVVLIGGINLDQNIASSDSLQPDDVPGAWIYDFYRVKNKASEPIRPEFSILTGKTYDDQDLIFSLAVALMERRGDFSSMVRGLVQHYDGKGWGLQQLDGQRTQVQDMLDLPDGQRPFDPQVAFMVDGQRRAMLREGATDVPDQPFGGLWVCTPIDVNGKNNGRIKDGGGGWFVPCVGPHVFDGRRSGLGGDDGDGGSLVGWAVLDEVNEEA